MEIHTQQSIFSDLADFIVSQPTLEAIADYRVPEPVQGYIDNLLEKNREQGLSPDEQLEMEKLLAVSQLMSLAKAKAKARIRIK